jgi:hypothetical protein
MEKASWALAHATKPKNIGTIFLGFVDLNCQIDFEVLLSSLLKILLR